MSQFYFFQGQLFSYQERNAAGKVVSVLRVRIPSSVKGKDSVFFDVESWSLEDNLRKQLNENAGKGRVAVQGEIRQDSWNDKKTGAKRSKVYVSARMVSFLGLWKDEENTNEGDAKVVNKVNETKEENIPF